MSNEAWRPLHEREAGSAAPEPALLDGVPPHLDDPLRRWLASFVESGSLAQRVALRLRIPAQGGETLRMTLSYYTDADQLLQAIDAALYFQPQGMSFAEKGQPANASGRQVLIDYFFRPVGVLSTILLDGASAWQVASNGRSLQRRVDATAQGAHAAATAAASASGRPEATRDLADAWAKVYGLDPEPSEAYRLAIRAVEDVAIPVVLPKDKNATLGKVRTHLRDTNARWHTSMGPGAEPVVAMISSLWISQTDRHAGQAELERVDRQAAEQAVHLATTLVQWFAAGHVQRVP